MFEITVFNAAVFLMGQFGTDAIAAHAIAIQIASTTFMVPMGVGQAATVRVGLAYGARDPDGITRAGWTAFALAIAFMAAMSALMLTVPHLLIAAFIDLHDPANAAVVGLAVSFLMWAAKCRRGWSRMNSGVVRMSVAITRASLFETPAANLILVFAASEARRL